MKKSKIKKVSQNSDYSVFLKEQLADVSLSAEYLSTAIQNESLDGFLIALKNVAEARGGIGALSRMTKLNRQNMYKMFSKKGNPSISSIFSVLESLGLVFAITPQQKKAA